MDNNTDQFQQFHLHNMQSDTEVMRLRGARRSVNRVWQMHSFLSMQL